VSKLAAIATFKMGNRRIQQVTEAAVMQNRNCSEEGTCGRQNRGQQRGDSSRNTQPLIDHSLLRSTASVATITRETGTVFVKEKN
jgi:hypothetical protein